MSLTDKEFIKRMRDDQLLCNFTQILKTADMKSLMLQLIISNIFNVIDINIGKIYQSKFYTNLEMKFQSFEWPLQKYMQRITKNDKYMNVLRLEDPRCLSNFKFLSDLHNLKSLLREIFASNNRALDTLQDCTQKFTVEADLRQELENNSEAMAMKSKELDNFCSYKKNEQEIVKDNYNNLVDSVMDELLIIDPIKIRYKTKVIRKQNEDIEDRLELSRIALKKAIDDCTKRFAVDEEVHEKTMELLKTQTETLRSKVNYWSRKYDDEYERISNKNRELKLTVRAMESNYETLQNRMHNFRIELARLGSVQLNKSVQKEIQDKKKLEKFKPLKTKLRLTKSQISLDRNVGTDIKAF